MMIEIDDWLINDFILRFVFVFFAVTNNIICSCLFINGHTRYLDLYLYNELVDNR